MALADPAPTDVLALERMKRAATLVLDPNVGLAPKQLGSGGRRAKGEAKGEGGRRPCECLSARQVSKLQALGADLLETAKRLEGGAEATEASMANKHGGPGVESLASVMTGVASTVAGAFAALDDSRRGKAEALCLEKLETLAPRPERIQRIEQVPRPWQLIRRYSCD